MSAYIIRRLLLIIPTLLAIITINFFLIQLAPGGPVDQAIAKEMGLNAAMLDRVTSTSAAATEARKKEQGDEGNSGYRASVGLTKEDIEKIKKQFSVLNLV